MKKIVATFLCLQVFAMHACAIETITDDFAEGSLSQHKNTTKHPDKKVSDNHITDDFAEGSLSQHTNTKKHPDKNVSDNQITDDFAEVTLKEYKNQKYDKGATFVCDFSADNYDNVSKQKMKLRVEKYLTTRQKPTEGSSVVFYTSEAVTLGNGKVIPKDTQVKAIVETVSQNGPFGVPADLIVGKFKVVEHPHINLSGQIEKTGANRSLWLYPTSAVAMLFLFSGFLLMPIRGGHAKLRTRDVYMVYVE